MRNLNVDSLLVDFLQTAKQLSTLAHNARLEPGDLRRSFFTHAQAACPHLRVTNTRHLRQHKNELLFMLSETDHATIEDAALADKKEPKRHGETSEDLVRCVLLNGDTLAAAAKDLHIHRNQATRILIRTIYAGTGVQIKGVTEARRRRDELLGAMGMAPIVVAERPKLPDGMEWIQVACRTKDAALLQALAKRWASC